MGWREWADSILAAGLGPDDADEPFFAPRCARCGRFVGKDARHEREPASHRGDAADWWACPACDHLVPHARTPEQCAADDAADWADYDCLMAEVHAIDAEAADLRAWEARRANETLEPSPTPIPTNRPSEGHTGDSSDGDAPPDR